jgi:hypothetical protein
VPECLSLVCRRLPRLLHAPGRFPPPPGAAPPARPPPARALLRTPQAYPETAASTGSYVQISADRNWGATPDARVRLGGRQGIERCKKLCTKRASKKKSPGCRAFSVSVEPAARGAKKRRFCNLFNLLQRGLCDPAAVASLCAQGVTSQGAWELEYA